MNLSRKLILFLVMQTLVFSLTSALFIHYKISPLYSVLEHTMEYTTKYAGLPVEEQIEIENYKKLKKSLIDFLIVFIGMGVFFTIGSLLFMHFLILKPIHTLRNQMHWIIRNKKFRPIHQPSTTKDEFADLTHHFNALIEHVIQQNQALENLSLTDPLTLLQNRRSLEQFMTTLGTLVKREPKHISIIMIDIDHFKLYNDFYGHVQGDKVIQRVAEVIMNHANRLSDFIARYGGEEFVVILPDTPMQSAKTIAENIRIEIENLQIPHETSTTTGYISVSIGASNTAVQNKDALLQLLEEADDALYHAKFEGRNRVVIHKKNNHHPKTNQKKDNS